MTEKENPPARRPEGNPRNLNTTTVQGTTPTGYQHHSAIGPQKRGKPIPLDVAQSTKDCFWAKVRKTEAGCWLWTSPPSNNGYGQFGINRYPYPAHRVAYAWANSDGLHGWYLDHICHNQLCVRPDHLRKTSNKQNVENKAGPNRNGSTGFLGVTRRRSGKYRAQVTHNGRFHHGGDYDTAEEAGAAATALRNRLFTHNDADRAEPLCNACRTVLVHNTSVAVGFCLACRLGAAA